MLCPLCRTQSRDPGPAPAEAPRLCAHCGSRPEDRELTWFLQSLAPPEPGTKLLDIGPPEARLRQARHLFPGLRYTAIDHDPREGESAAFTPGQRFLVMDVTRLAFSDQAFPLILAPFVLAEVRSDYAAMWELHRCLHNDGMAVLTEPLITTKTKRFAEWEGQAASLPPESRNRPLAWAYGEDFFERLEAAGFFVERLDLRALAGAERAREYAFREVPELILGFKYGEAAAKFRDRLKPKEEP